MQTPKVTKQKIGGIAVFSYHMVETTIVECPPLPECGDGMLPPTGAPEPPRPTSVFDVLARCGAFQAPCGPAVGKPFGKEPYESRSEWPWLKRNWPWAHRLIFGSPTYIGK